MYKLNFGYLKEIAPKKGSKEAPNILGVLWCFVFKMGLGERVHLKTISDFFYSSRKKEAAISL